MKQYEKNQKSVSHNFKNASKEWRKVIYMILGENKREGNEIQEEYRRNHHLRRNFDHFFSIKNNDDDKFVLMLTLRNIELDICRRRGKKLRFNI
jgi:hypothetical protein